MPLPRLFYMNLPMRLFVALLLSGVVTGVALWAVGG